MKKTCILLALILSSGIYTTSLAENDPSNKDRTETTNTNKGEQTFIKYADECLNIISEAAKKESITGATMIAFIPGDATSSWISKMKVVGRLADDKSNFLAIIYAKAAEMAVTLRDSGNEERKSITGELGWQGGAILKVNGGYLVGAFSGGTGQQDYDVSKLGLEWLAEKYK
ncbi:MAG: hypothetical protein U5K79_01325 [Cyclobacteriaceae bacterium]|nr:hypothetical protein [Cyclobacteriaceae bacterium]